MSVLRSVLLGIVLFAAAFGIYHSNGTLPMGSLDSVPNSLLADDLFSRGRLDFDVLRGGSLVRGGAAYAFVESPSGHYASIFPIGTALVTLPLYALFDLAHHIDGTEIDIASPAFDAVRQHDEKAVATIVAALAVVLFFFVARDICGTLRAAVATVAFGFGSEMWAIGSQALWQHGVLCLVLLKLVFCFQRARRGHARGWLFAAGLCAGLLIAIRPTGAVYTLAALAFVLRFERRAAVPFAGGAALGIAPLAAWNAYFFHSLLGGYAPNVGTFTASPASVFGALAGELFSPNRGLFVFTPVFAFALFGAYRAARARTREGTLLSYLGAASAALCGLYAFYPQWYGGWTYGPRFLTDVTPVAALLIVYALPLGRAWAAAFGVLLVYSVGVQAVGTNSGTAGARWNAVPVSIDADPARVWDWNDWQIAWNARTFSWSP